MMPTIGRIIHVYVAPTDQCLAAIVTALDDGHHVPVPIVYCTVFPPHGVRDDAAGRLILPHDGTWHDPRDCHARGVQGDHFAHPATDAPAEPAPVLGDPGRAGERP